MGIVPEYGAPGNVQGAVQRLEGGRDGFSREAVRQFERLGVGLEGDEFDVPRLQAGGLDALAVLKVDDEQFVPGLGYRAQFGRHSSEGKLPAPVDEFGRQDVVGKGIAGGSLLRIGRAGGGAREDDCCGNGGNASQNGGHQESFSEEFHGLVSRKMELPCQDRPQRGFFKEKASRQERRLFGNLSWFSARKELPVSMTHKH